MPSPQEFAASIKAKYPQYAEIPDDELVTRILDKHPVYRDRISQPAQAAGGIDPAKLRNPGRNREENTGNGPPSAEPGRVRAETICHW